MTDHYASCRETPEEAAKRIKKYLKERAKDPSTDLEIQMDTWDKAIKMLGEDFLKENKDG